MSSKYPLRPNILIIAGLIAAVCGGIVTTIIVAMLAEIEDSGLILGALIGILSGGLTGLAGLGTTLVNESKLGE